MLLRSVQSQHTLFQCETRQYRWFAGSGQLLYDLVTHLHVFLMPPGKQGRLPQQARRGAIASRGERCHSRVTPNNLVQGLAVKFRVALFYTLTID